MIGVSPRAKASRETSMNYSGLTWGARSDTGRVRQNNEDSFRIDAELGLFVLSDGMGGQASGEVASRLATETVVARCRAASSSGSVCPRTERSESSEILAGAIRYANTEIREAAARNSAWRGMGATIVAALFDEQWLSIAHVGDSRAYRLRSGQLEQLTEDHSFVAEQVRRGILTQQQAERSNLQNVLMRALGPDEEAEVGIREDFMNNGDTILLCSDGLTREVSNAQISSVLAAARDAQAAADQLVELANRAGGEDNITVIVLRRQRAQPLGWIGRWFKGFESKS